MELLDRFSEEQIIDFINFRSANDIVQPIHEDQIYSEEGELEFYLVDKDFYLDIGFPGDGTYNFFARIDKADFLGDDLSVITDLLPTEIRDAAQNTLSK